MASSKLMEPAAWKGLWTALITPLKTSASGPSLDDASLAKLIEAQIEGGVQGLVIAGSTGEGSLLSDEVYASLLKASRRIAGNRIALVAGIGIGGTRSCLKNLALAKQCDFDGVLASPPAYVKAPQRALVDHYLTLGAEGLPVCVYEVASRAASSIEVRTLADLCDQNHKGARYIVATKDASAKMERALETSALLGDRIALLSGDDFTWAPFLACGGTGLISVVSHFVPQALRKIQSLSIQGEVQTAVAEQNRITPLIEALFWESNPIPVKSLAHALGHIAHLEFERPLVAMDSAKLERLVALAKKTPDVKG